ncbi:MAG: hypothetical protein KKB95_09370 [Gammaproteobacteria bacterium]|nr:hypothetical protein [Gammaproteobacteria bacterium]MBU1505771.1 hypothetical protein [Gammaproteobacteria bacterium]MBU2119459.1 hypothetical protein [Gammaproteobacteria bacterium]MBU2172635.1 hypothetical protein [Gammaproteobacteria bacterium]MBU2202093.1 hypothetical protein [Gammaproteobacteria bacterium]
MLLASYKVTRPGLQGIANRVIRLRLRSIYSHCEVVFEPEDHVDQWMPDGSAARGGDGSLWCASSVAGERLPETSARRPGRMGGVRFKRIALNPDHWDVRRIASNPAQAAQWFKAHEGELYDWQLILGFVSWVIPHKSERWTCSEASAAAQGVAEGEAWRFDPANLDAAAGAWM